MIYSICILFLKIAPPGPPTGPLEVTNLTKSGCTLTWKPPKDDGGNRVLHYVIEKRDCSKKLWIPYADHCKVCFKKKRCKYFYAYLNLIKIIFRKLH